MFKKIILFLLISSLAVSGFAQKTKRKTSVQSPKSSYFVMVINGEQILTDTAGIYCPGDLVFNFVPLDTNANINIINYCWYDSYRLTDAICNKTPINLDFQISPNVTYPNVTSYKVSVFFDILIDTVVVKDTLNTIIKIDYERITVLETSVCYGRDITITMRKGDTTLYDVRGQETIWETISGSELECDTLLRYFIDVEPRIIEEYSISSCDSVIWGDIVIKRPPDHEGDYTTPLPIERVFLAHDPESGCDTLKTLKVTIIGERKLEIKDFTQEDFCKPDDPLGTIELETNFTAFNWTFNPDKYESKDRDTTFTEFEPSPATKASLEIQYSGHYYVLAYMDTSLYDTLRDLRIVNCYSLLKYLQVEDCPLIIPNVITPNDDGYNDWLGIKKLNPERENELVIYDRWGKNVFSQKNYKCVFRDQKYHNIEDAFAGKARGGRPLPDGTYYYAFIYDAIPKLIKYTGTIVILRD
ncbi:MAG: gliding motility-associated C-terminal domain-containing protein [Lentimicrobiaceae bacterium]|nr:gliding motility-associated C-terminal domain-containing protein [Lentimicrobiaceae bacterium]